MNGNELVTAICGLVGSRTGLWMGTDMQRRMARILPKRLSRGQYRQSSEYYHFLRDDPFSNQEFARLAAMLTERKPRLAEPQLCGHLRRFLRPRTQGQLAVLAIGPYCAEDIYSAAIAAGQEGIAICTPSVVLMAADIDLDRLLRGADGSYSSRAVSAVGQQAMEEFFEAVTHRQYRVRDALRGLVHWLHVSPLGGWNSYLCSRRWDLIVCREFLDCLNAESLKTWLSIGELLSPGGLLIADRRVSLTPGLECRQSGRLWLHTRCGGWNTSLPKLHDANELFPAFPPVVDILGRDDCDAALHNVEGMVCSEPFNASCRVALAILLLRKKAVKEAETQALAALALQPHQPEALLACAMACERQGRLRSAEEFYRKVLLVRPTMAIAYLQLAVLYKKSGRAAEAQKTYERFRSAIGGLFGRQITVGSSLRKVFRVDIKAAPGPTA